HLLAPVERSRSASKRTAPQWQLPWWVVMIVTLPATSVSLMSGLIERLADAEQEARALADERHGVVDRDRADRRAPQHAGADALRDRAPAAPVEDPGSIPEPVHRDAVRDRQLERGAPRAEHVAGRVRAGPIAE